MIRDEYNKKKESVKFNAKEERKKKELGERNFYATQIPKLTDLCKVLSKSLLWTTIFLGIAYALVLASFILLYGTKDAMSVVEFSIYTTLFALFVIFYLLWIFVFKPSNLKKIDRYKVEIDRINFENFKKASYGYKPVVAEKNEQKTENNQ